ncbi:hypothetical protein B9Z55_000776 [Caenorhabditis nigoni]|uniref:Uncharacterized protein n=1 Tax=Caenorhabditis nigoni TaxID=1611254 RepID=A0A2G5VV60_9PELO|nr:hypothetical protein B9Z55_000776 [Caenorhabditis nigoni]
MYFQKRARKSPFSGTSTDNEHSGKGATVKENGRKTGTSEVSKSRISRELPGYMYLLIEFACRNHPPSSPLGPSSKRQKLTEGEASTPFQPAQLHRKGNI